MDLQRATEDTFEVCLRNAETSAMFEALKNTDPPIDHLSRWRDDFQPSLERIASRSSRKSQAAECRNILIVGIEKRSLLWVLIGIKDTDIREKLVHTFFEDRALQGVRDMVQLVTKQYLYYLLDGIALTILHTQQFDSTIKIARFPEPKQPPTIHRWMLNGVPVKRPFQDSARAHESDWQIFGFCGLLDVDLLAIFDYQRNGYFSKFATIRQLIYLGRRALGGLAPLLEMYRPGDVWPSNEIAETCYGRPWFAREFTNADDWHSNHYILVRIGFVHSAGTQPRAVHIAYRRVGVPDTMWRYYGTVLAIDGELQLYNESGGYQSMAQGERDEIRFRTYYGGRPVEWRIVSLHEFVVGTKFPFDDMTTIGFNW